MYAFGLSMLQKQFPPDTEIDRHNIYGVFFHNAKSLCFFNTAPNVLNPEYTRISCTLINTRMRSRAGVFIPFFQRERRSPSAWIFSASLCRSPVTPKMSAKDGQRPFAE